MNTLTEQGVLARPLKYPGASEGLDPNNVASMSTDFL
jgi:hypothetical protein